MIDRYQEIFFFGMGMVFVAIPWILGAIKGHIHKSFFVRWALSLSVATLFLAIGVNIVENQLTPVWRLIGSMMLGVVWVCIGIQMAWIERKIGVQHLNSQAKFLRKTISWMFAGFGMIWMGISIWQYINH